MLSKSLAILAVFAALVPAPAAAYAEFIHEMLPGKIFAADPQLLDKPVKVDERALAAFRKFVYDSAARISDPDLRRAFVHRYPTEASFDAYAFKEFLMLDPTKEVMGIDRVGGEKTVGDVLAQGSRYPDDDRRNRDRFARNLDRQTVNDEWQQPIPFDPATLWMGNLKGTSSQAHAHYQTLPPPLSDDPEVLKKDPARFGIPPELETFGADFGQLYTDLSLLAALSGIEGGEYLSRLFEGAWMHHAGDVCNQIHTVQVGLYEFFVDAKMESLQEELFSLGGLLRDRPSFMDIGKQILTNHHLLSEQLFAKRVEEAKKGAVPPEIAPALQALEAGDAALQEALAKLSGDPLDVQFGRGIILAIVEQSSKEAADVYRATRTFAKSELSYAGGVYDESMDPDLHVKTSVEAKLAMNDLFVLQARGFGRAASAFRAWQAAYVRALAAIPAGAPAAVAAAPEPEKAAAPAMEAPEWTRALADPAQVAEAEKAAAAALAESVRPKPAPSLAGALGPGAQQAVDKIAARMVRQLLEYHRKAQERRDAYEPEAPAMAQETGWWMPAGVGVAAGVLGATVFLLAR